jgi:L-ascorbate metabolism protein UlaG (beta-lactamase superfamily)
VTSTTSMGPTRSAKRTRPKRRWLRWLRNAAIALVALLAVLVILGWISTDGFAAFGGSPDDETLARMQSSPQFRGDHFENLEPTTTLKPGTELATLEALVTGDEMRSPTCPLPMKTGGAALRTPPSSGLRVTWLGHSTTLIEVDGSTVLTDPMWSERSSPSRWVGPTRFHPPPIAIEDLPHVDAVLISHDHYDHLDMETTRALAERGVEFHVPLGLRAHLEAFGIDERVIEHDWWEPATLGSGARVVSTPSRHFCGRGVPWHDGTLWTSWVIAGDRHRVFYSGDTGLTESFRETARREGPFDVALLEIGQFHENWPQIHLGPAGALEAFEMLGARTLVPVHWATFELAYHDWSEPAETLFTLANERGVALATPMLGESFEPTEAVPRDPWWRALPPTAPACPNDG